MKVLNRPMFRYGGPIKEGIMSGIKEPRRGYNQGNMVFPANAAAMGIDSQNAAKAFQNIFANQYSNQNPFIQPDNSMSRKEKMIKTYEPKAEALKKSGQIAENIFSGQNFYTDEEGNKRSRNTGEIIRDTDISEVITEPRGPAEYGIDTRKTVKPDVKLPGDTDPQVEKTRKEKVNNILESLGYDRAQKNALYDAMIKAGQRISRGGLGADNLVSDVIAETSQSYDKPEKLREAANLMDAQQQLKLEQIEASKDTRSPMQKNADYFLESGVAKNTEDAIRMARNLPVTVSETFQTKVKEFGKSEGLVQTAIDLSERGQFGNLEFEGKIDKKYKGKDLSEFLASPGFKGDGVYTADGKILVIQNGDIKQTINVRGSVEDSLFNFGGEK